MTAGDVAAGRLLRARRLVDRALSVITMASRLGPIGISTSGGKDSAVVVDLVRRVVPDAPAAWFDSGCELTGTADLIAQQLAERIAPVRSLPDMCRYCGWWGYRQPEDESATFDVRETLIYEPSVRFATAHGLRVMALGLRAAESDGRAMDAYTHGELYEVRADGRWRLCPLAYWSDADVWAYLAAREVPYHPAYDAMARIGLPRREWRIGTALGGINASRGRVAVIRQIDPVLYRRLAAEFPLWAAEA